MLILGNVEKSAAFGLFGDVCFGVSGDGPAEEMVVDG